MRSPTARSLAVKRLRVHRLVLTATACAVLVLSVLLGAIVGLGTRAPEAALRASLIATPVAETVSAPLAKDASKQDVAVRRIIATTFRGAPVRVTAAPTGTGHWTILPSPRLTPDELPALAKGYAHLKANIAREYPAAGESGTAARTVASLRGALAAASAVIPIPIGVVGLAGVIALALCGQLLAATRDNETRLLRARGGRIATLVVTDAIESLVIAIPAAVIGGVLAQAGLALWLGAPTGVGEVVLPVVATIVLAGMVAAIGSFVAARGASGAPRQASGRATGIASVGVTVLVLALAGIATWRFLSFGAPTPGTPEDASALIAPAALLGSAALVGLILLGPTFGVIERLASRRRSVGAVLPPRQVHRASILYAGVVASVILSVATATLASGYTATWSTYLAESSRLVTGSDLRATFGGGTLDSDASTLLTPRSYAKAPGVTAIAPVVRDADSIGTENLTTIGIPAKTIRGIVGPDTSLLSASALQRELTPASNPLPGIALPADASSVRVYLDLAARTSGPDSVVAPTLWIADALGDVAPLSLGQLSIRAGERESVSVRLPSGGPWTIVALDSHVISSAPVAGFTFEISDLTVVEHGRPSPFLHDSRLDWVPQTAVFVDTQAAAAAVGTLGFFIDSVPGGQTDTAVRLMPKGSAIVPVVVSRALAEANGLRVGNRVDVSGTWASFQGRVAGIVPLVPGVTSGASLIADLPSLDSGWLRTSEQLPALHELWIASPDASSTARRIEDVPGRVAHVTLATAEAGRAFVANAVVGLWLGAVGSIAFVILALVAAVAVMLRRRSDELGVLRALGVTSVQQARLRRAEFVIVSLYAAVIGVVLGTAIALTTVAVLARASTPSAPLDLDVAPAFDLLSILAVLAILAVAVAIILARYGAVVHASARRATP